MKTYTEACAANDAINARVYALKAPRIDAGTEAHEAYDAAKFAIAADAKALGFIRIFDGSYKLNAEQVRLPG